MMKKIDYAEHGGSPLLGLNGICIICHGRSSARAILNAIRQAARSVEAGLQDEIKHSIEEEFSESNA
jgi:glycerol-3-phosphate acyltransferase PlsX